METSTASITPPIDWPALQRLVEQSAYPPERFPRLQRQLAVQTPSAEGRLTLLVGQPTVVDLFISRWLSPDLLDGLGSAGAQPLVLGRRPESVRTDAGVWTRLKAAQPSEGHLIVVRAARRFPPQCGCGLHHWASSHRWLSSPGWDNRCPQSNASLCVRCRVRGPRAGAGGRCAWRRASDRDAADLLAYGKTRIQSNGYSYGRYPGLSVWYTSGGKKTANDR